MGFDLHALDRATDGFFGAALDPTLWPAVLEKVSAASGSYGANIVPIEGRLLHTFIVTESLVPAMEDYFAGEWYKQDFRTRHVSMLRRAGGDARTGFCWAKTTSRHSISTAPRRVSTFVGLQ